MPQVFLYRVVLPGRGVGEDVEDEMKDSNRFNELINTTADNDYDQCKERNDDLSTLAEGVVMTNAMLGATQSSATVTKEALVCAYLLGRRDAVKVPDVFADA